MQHESIWAAYREHFAGVDTPQLIEEVQQIHTTGQYEVLPNVLMTKFRVGVIEMCRRGITFIPEEV